jgi:hypothetical protein
MANNKTGFAYFNIDTDRYQDIRIKKLKKNFGCNGIAVYDYILCEIYRVKGCFIVWDESTAFDVADYLMLKESVVKEIVNYCGVVGLFDKELLTRGSILTSQSIQRRFVEMSIRAKRTSFFIPEPVKIPEESVKLPEESVKLPEECTQSSGSLTQRRVEESKEEESREEESDRSRAPDFTKIHNVFFKYGLIQKDADKFLNHYKSHGWKTKEGFIIKNWEAKAEKWASEEKEKSCDKKENGGTGNNKRSFQKNNPAAKDRNDEIIKPRVDYETPSGHIF